MFETGDIIVFQNTKLEKERHLHVFTTTTTTVACAIVLSNPLV